MVEEHPVQVISLQVDKGDPFPPQICDQCRNKIIEFYVLKQKCTVSHKIFLEIQHLDFDFSLKPLNETPQPKKVNNETQTEVLSDVTTDDRKPKVVDGDMSTEEAFNYGMTYRSVQNKAINYLSSGDNEGVDQGILHFCNFYANFTEGNCLYCDAYFENVVRMQKHFTELHEDVTSYYLNFLETTGNKLNQEQTNEMDDDLQLEEEEIVVFNDHNNEDTGMTYLDDDAEDIDSQDVQDNSQESIVESSEVKWKRNIVTSSDQSVFGVEPDKHKCDLCLVVIQTEEKVKEHQRVHQEVNPVLFELVEHYICRSCNVVFLDLKDVQTHLPCMTGPHPNPRLEKFDPTFLVSLENAASRFMVFQAKYEDNNDSKSNSEQSQVCIEIEDVRGYHPDVGDFTCGICSKHFGTVAEIKCHTYLHQPSYTCPVEDCNQVFDFSKKLILHIKYNHINRRRLAMENMECVRCETVFTDPKVFMQHIRLDCEMRKLKCNYCSRRFFNTAAKKNHEKTHAESKAEEVIQCDICSDTFDAVNQLRVHVARNHAGVKPYKCTHCDKRFNTPSHRADHEESHSTERKYQCEMCESKFKSHRVLQSHMKIHTEGKTHACPICGKLFSRSFHVKLHYKTHAKEDNDVSELGAVNDKNQ